MLESALINATSEPVFRSVISISSSILMGWELKMLHKSSGGGGELATYVEHEFTAGNPSFLSVPRTDELHVRNDGPVSVAISDPSNWRAVFETTIG